MPRARQAMPAPPRLPVGPARATRDAAPSCPLPCRCGARLRSCAPTRCPLPLDPLGPVPEASARALADLGLGPDEIARYAAVPETRVHAALRAGRH